MEATVEERLEQQSSRDKLTMHASLRAVRSDGTASRIILLSVITTHSTVLQEGEKTPRCYTAFFGKYPQSRQRPLKIPTL